MEKILGTALRLVIVYIFLLVMLRLSGKTLVGQGKQGAKNLLAAGTPFDFIAALVISDLPDDIIFASVPVAQGVVAVGTLVVLHLAIGYLAFRLPTLARLVQSSPQPLMQRGQSVRRTMARERINEAELDAMLRQHHIERRGDVAEALLEPSGALSVRRREQAKPAQQSDLADVEELLT